MRMRINASRLASCVVAEVTVTNNIPKSYSRELSMTNDIRWHKVCTYVRADWPRCGPEEGGREGERERGRAD